MATPHNAAQPGDIAETVLMPGDPLRAQFIAGQFLTDVTCYNSVRAMYGATGYYHGVRISVQGSGMGCPSMGIYSHELFHEYGVKRILRVGTAGAVAPYVKLRDVVLAMGVCTDSNYPAHFTKTGIFAPIASYSLLAAAAQHKTAGSGEIHVGNVLSTDCFYDEDPEALRRWGELGVLAVEMETAALYTEAALAGREALAIFTISDCPLRGETTSAAERESSFTDTITLALETAIAVTNAKKE